MQDQLQLQFAGEESVRQITKLRLAKSEFNPFRVTLWHSFGWPLIICKGQTCSTSESSLDHANIANMLHSKIKYILNR